MKKITEVSIVRENKLLFLIIEAYVVDIIKLEKSDILDTYSIDDVYNILNKYRKNKIILSDNVKLDIVI